MRLRDIPLDTIIISKKEMISGGMRNIPKGTAFKVDRYNSLVDNVTLLSLDGKYLLRRPGYLRAEDYFETAIEQMRHSAIFGCYIFVGIDKAGDEMAKKEPEAKTMINSEPEKFGYTFKSGNVDFDEIAEELSRENPILHVSVEKGGKRQDSVLVHHSLLNKAELCDIKPPAPFYESVRALKDSGLYGMGHTNSKLFIGVKSYRKVWKKWVDDVVNAKNVNGVATVKVMR